MSIHSSKKLLCICLVVFACASAGISQTRGHQRNEVIEAYHVCNRFQTLLAADLDFDRAFEATFARNSSRRREIAITEGEFDGDSLAAVDTATLVYAFKSRMQLLF